MCGSWGGAIIEDTAQEVRPGQIDAVLKYLPIFEGGDFEPGEWLTREGCFPNFLYSPEVNDFIQTLYEQGIIYVFGWTSWKEEAERYQSDLNSLAGADLLTLRKLLAAHVRADRFVEGHLASVFESGHITAILRRLKQIRDKMAGGA